MGTRKQIAAGIIVTIRAHQVVAVETCGSHREAVRAVEAFVDADPEEERLALGYEQSPMVGPFAPIAPSGWYRAEVAS